MWLVRFVSRHELFPIRAPLMALEHCIAPFLDRCDEDDDHRITLAEWGKCLQLDEVYRTTSSLPTCHTSTGCLLQKPESYSEGSVIINFYKIVSL